MKHFFGRSIHIWYTTAIVVLGACGDGENGTMEPDLLEPDLPRPTSMQVVSGDAQSGTVGQQLGSSIVVQVKDQNGNPMSGVGVTFAVSNGGGSVGGSGTTDNSGQASTTWTLGTTAGVQQRVTASVSSATNIKATLTATANPDAPAVISAVSGNDQFGFMGTKLADPIVIRVQDQFANSIANHLVQFTVASGNGSLDAASAFTDAQGRALTSWTMPNSTGAVTAQASSDGLVGSPLMFSATSHDTQILSVTDPLVEGQPAVITGTGFNPDPPQNVVTIGGLPVVVDAATDTQLDITVPSSCSPAGNVSVDLVAAGIPAAPFTSTLAPANPLSLAPGEQLIVQDPADFCFQFDETTGTETYLIGVQNVNETATNRTAVTLRSDARSATPAPAFAFTAPRVTRPLDLDPRGAQRLEILRRRRIAHVEYMARALEDFTMPSPILRAAGSAPIPPNLQVGDVVDVRVGDTCNDFTTLSTTVRAVGAGSVWLSDNANPAGGFSDSDFQSFSDRFDNTIMPTNEDYFGAINDVDMNGYVVAVVTKEVNRRGIAGFISLDDLLTEASCAASNEGEIFYAWTPDEGEVFGDALPFDIALELMPVIAAHETVHLIQVGHRAAAMQPLQALWELEGQATLGEEVNGHAALGNMIGQNYNNAVAFDLPQTEPIDWYFGAFIDLLFYYGADYAGLTPAKIATAPEDCTWLASDVVHACDGSLVHGVPFSFFRWLSDQFGSNFGGGEKDIHRMLIDNTMTGFANVADVIGQPIETLLAQWAAMLYVDNRRLADGTPVSANPILTMTSWNMFSLFDGTVFNDARVHRLEPTEYGFQDFAKSLNVRAGSTAYVLVSSIGRSATAIKARDFSDQTLPSHMQYWVVRLR